MLLLAIDVCITVVLSALWLSTATLTPVVIITTFYNRKHIMITGTFQGYIIRKLYTIIITHVRRYLLFSNFNISHSKQTSCITERLGTTIRRADKFQIFLWYKHPAVPTNTTAVKCTPPKHVPRVTWKRMRAFVDFFVVSLIKLANKHSSCRWFAFFLATAFGHAHTSAVKYAIEDAKISIFLPFRVKITTP